MTIYTVTLTSSIEGGGQGAGEISFADTVIFDGSGIYNDTFDAFCFAPEIQLFESFTISHQLYSLNDIQNGYVDNPTDGYVDFTGATVTANSIEDVNALDNANWLVNEFYQGRLADDVTSGDI